MRESNIGGAARTGPSPCSVRSAGCAAAVDDTAQQFVTYHPKSLPPTHPHSTLLLVPWDASTNRCARQASSLSTTREMKVQRSTGKRILAVVAGVGLAAGLTVGVAPGAAADYTMWTATATGNVPGSYDMVTCGGPIDDRDRTKAMNAASGECRRGGYNNIAPSATSYIVVDPPANVDEIDEIASEAIDPVPPPPPCWSAEAGGNCPVGGALQAAAPAYMIAGVPQQVLLYSSWRPAADSAPQPTSGTAVMRMNGEDIASAPFVDGVATFSFTPTKPGLKDVTFSGVVSSGISGQSAYLDSVKAATMVLPYDPELLEEALKNKKVEVGDTYTLEERAQAKTALGKRLEWRVDQDSSDVCAVTTTKKGEVRAKFTESGKCSIIWTDPKKDEEGKYTFKVTA